MAVSSDVREILQLEDGNNDKPFITKEAIIARAEKVKFFLIPKSKYFYFNNIFIELYFVKFTLLTSHY